MSDTTIAPVRRSVFVAGAARAGLPGVHRGLRELVARLALDRRGRLTETAIIELAEGGRWYERGLGGGSATGGGCSRTSRRAAGALLAARRGVRARSRRVQGEPGRGRRFTPEGGGTRVEIVHSGFDRRGEGGEGVAGASPARAAGAGCSPATPRSPRPRAERRRPPSGRRPDRWSRAASGRAARRPRPGSARRGRRRSRRRGGAGPRGRRSRAASSARRPRGGRRRRGAPSRAGSPSRCGRWPSARSSQPVHQTHS